MLTLDAVSISVGSFRLQASLSVDNGRICAVMGPSGAGKSTLIGAIGGFIESSGMISFDGAAFDGLQPGARPASTVFQDNNLFPHMTAFQNVALGIRGSTRLSLSEKERVQSALVHVGLAGLGERKPAALSGGQQSRIALARVLIRDKPLVLLDEPFAALGPALKFEMLDLVATLASERALTVLMVTHDPEDARRIADETIVVADGIAHAPQPTADLLDHPPLALRDYLGA
ncbi:MAG: ATP-binding cassette domain-containing protein [Litoreibacter sp.]